MTSVRPHRNRPERDRILDYAVDYWACQVLLKAPERAFQLSQKGRPYVLEIAAIQAFWEATKLTSQDLTARERRALPRVAAAVSRRGHHLSQTLTTFDAGAQFLFPGAEPEATMSDPLVPAAPHIGLEDVAKLKETRDWARASLAGCEESELIALGGPMVQQHKRSPYFSVLVGAVSRGRALPEPGLFR